jgi:hypothetical protein
MASFAFYFVTESFPIARALGVVFLGSSLTLAYGVVIVLIVIGGSMYVTGKVRLQRLGIDLKALYAEIPPE